jgi:hypothetical protein
MDRSFWQAIKDANYAVPHGYSAVALTPILLSYLGAVDPEVRQGPNHDALEEWVHRGVYSPDELRALAAGMLANLRQGLGEEESDTVFLRSFSLLILNEIIEEDNLHPFLDAATLRAWMEAGLSYLAAERDLRGYVPEKGWAHAVAHAADFLMVLARNRHLSAPDLACLLDAIASRLDDSLGYVYLYEEDERLAYAVMAVLRRDLLRLPLVKRWLDRLANRPWTIEDFYTADTAARYHNIKLFLRSLYFQLTLAADPPALASELLPLLQDAIKAMDRGYYALP